MMARRAHLFPYRTQKLSSLAPRVVRKCESRTSLGLSICGCSLMVELQPSKLTVRVRFSSPAPIANSALERVLFLCVKSGNEEQGFRRVMKKSYPQVIQKTKKDKKWIKGLTTFDRHDKIIKSSKEDKKTSKKCLTERVKHDKIIKSLKQVTKKFFEN